jgi:Uma2 family endonuclease
MDLYLEHPAHWAHLFAPGRRRQRVKPVGGSSILHPQEAVNSNHAGEREETAMASTQPTDVLRAQYEEAARAYLRSLPLKHFMEATPQGTQRAITLASLALVKARRPDVQYFNELLVQDRPRRAGGKLIQVVPDNMVVVWDEPIEAVGSYDVPVQPVGPYWVLEYVSKNSERKDYEDSFHKYERYLKVPYCLFFYPDNGELTLYHHGGRRYVSVKPNQHGRLALAEVDLEVALLEGWVRFWYRGNLLPLPETLQQDLDKLRKKLKQANRQAKAAQLHAEEQTRKAEEQTRKAEEQTRKAEEQTRKAEEERQARLAAEQESAQLRARLAALEGKRSLP